VSIDAFFEHFEGKQECFLAALDMLGERLLRLASEREGPSDEWPRAVRARIGELLGYLADHPIYAQTIADGAFAAGPEAIETNVALANAVAAALTDGAPVVADGALAVQGVAGALSHTVRCQVASGQIQLLSVLSDYLSYIVLAPFVGSEHAAKVVIEAA
jgi:AcrR family transcriptional regulator